LQVNWPGIREPATESADSARLNDGATVFGVSVNGQSRAYSMMAMTGSMRHVINDVVGGAPVSLTFCEVTNCVRVFTKTEQGANPLDVSVRGWKDGQLWLGIDGQNFPQDSREIPLEDLTCERTSWKAWKDAHADSDVFVGLDGVSASGRTSGAPGSVSDVGE
jgi:hypothetical protein